MDVNWVKIEAKDAAAAAVIESAETRFVERAVALLADPEATKEDLLARLADIAKVSNPDTIWRKLTEDRNHSPFLTQEQADTLDDFDLIALQRGLYESTRAVLLQKFPDAASEIPPSQFEAALPAPASPDTLPSAPPAETGADATIAATPAARKRAGAAVPPGNVDATMARADTVRIKRVVETDDERSELNERIKAAEHADLVKRFVEAAGKEHYQANVGIVTEMSKDSPDRKSLNDSIEQKLRLIERKRPEEIAELARSFGIDSKTLNASELSLCKEILVHYAQRERQYFLELDSLRRGQDAATTARTATPTVEEGQTQLAGAPEAPPPPPDKPEKKPADVLAALEARLKAALAKSDGAKLDADALGKEIAALRDADLAVLVDEIIKLIQAEDAYLLEPEDLEKARKMLVNHRSELIGKTQNKEDIRRQLAEMNAPSEKKKAPKRVTKLNGRIMQKINPRPAIVVPSDLPDDKLKEIEGMVDDYLKKKDATSLDLIRNIIAENEKAR